VPRKKPVVEGKRVNVWLPPPQLETANEIENLSRFVQLCLDNATEFMAWFILKEIDPVKYHNVRDPEGVIEQFNEKYPLDPLTAKRQGKWRTNSPKLPDVLS